MRQMINFQELKFVSYQAAFRELADRYAFDMIWIISTRNKCKIQKMNLDEMVEDAQYYLKDSYQRKPQALILVPTREIAIQVSEDINKLLPINLRCVSLYSDPQ